MDILKKFTLKDVKLNKKRTIVTIIGIMLSTALICGVIGIVSSFQSTFIDMTLSHEGNYHTTFKNISSEDLKYITNNNKVESYFLTSRIGWAKLEGSKNENKPYVSVMEYDKKAMDNYGIRMIEGRKPENNREIVISNDIISNGRVDLKIGDEITFDIGKRMMNDGTKLLSYNCYWVDKDSNVIEEIVETTPKTYKVVGIMESPSYKIEDFSSPGYTVITAMEGEVSNYNISVLYTKIGETVDNNKEISKTLNLEEDSENICVNKDYLRFSGVMDREMISAMYLIAGVVMTIIVVSSVFVIRNSFSISVSEKNRQYGMLASVGATSKQIKKTVLFEGFIIGVIAIPLGILLGIIAIILLLQVVNILMKEALNGFDFSYSLPIVSVLITVLISVITIYFSCLIPAKKAAKISPIEAIRGNNDIKIKNKKFRTNKFIKKFFGIGGVIASKNLKRSRKKYRTTIISIVVSIVIFISLSSFVDCGKRETSLYFKEAGYNISIYSDDLETYNNVLKLNNIENYAYYYETNAEIDTNKYTTDIGKKVMDSLDKYGDEEKDIHIMACNNRYFKQYLKEIGVNESEYGKAAVLIDDFVANSTDNKKSVERIYNLNEGDELVLQKNEKSMTFNINKITDKRPMGFEKTYYTSGLLIVSEDCIKNLNKDEYSMTDLYIQSNDCTALENTLIDLSNTDVEYKDIVVWNLEKIMEQETRIVIVVEIFLYGFITVISLIGVTNIFNTITTNMILRSKEFAMLKSIGMTSNEFDRMIRLESILYGLKSLIIGIPLGILGSYFVSKAYAENIDVGFHIPVNSILISIVVVFLIVGLTMKYSLKKINKQNIIETIRRDNI